MGYNGKLEEKQKALRLRKQGYSYSEIQEKVNVSKDTLSRWCRDVILSPSKLERLRRRKLTGAEKGRIKGAKVQQKRRMDEIKHLLKTGRKEVGKLSRRGKFLAGIALYAAEGEKGDGKIGFANSDPRLIKFMMAWFRNYCKVPEHKFRGAIWIHEGLNTVKARKFWSRLTGIPINQFHKTYIAKNKVESKKVRKNKHEHGVFSIRIFDTKVHRKIMGWISGLFSS